MPGELAAIAFGRAERATIVTIEGEIDMSNAQYVHDELMARVGAAPWVLVDLSHCSYVDSAGLGVIARIDARCREVGARLRLVVEAGSGIDRVLSMTRLNEFLCVERTLEDALEGALEDVPAAPSARADA